MSTDFLLLQLHNAITHYAVESSNSGLLLVISCGIILSLFIASLFSLFLPPQFKQHKGYFFLLIWLSGIFIPLFGALFIGGIIYIMLFISKHQADTPIKTVYHPSFSLEEEAHIKTLGEGSARMQVQMKQLSHEVRTQSLLSLNALNSREANAVIEATMQDNDDQIRLLAFSLLNKQEEAIHKKIKDYQIALDSMTDPKQQAELYAKLAANYWELIYLNLASGEMRNTAINKAKKYAELACKHLSKHAELLVLLGKIYLHLQHYEDALTVFNQAKALKISHNNYVPYIAEIYFKLKDYQRVRNLFDNEPTLKFIPKMGPVIKYWSSHDG